MTTHALVQCMRVARRDLRLEHELALLDGSDAVTNLVTPPPHPERSTDGPWLGLRDDHEPPTTPSRAQHRRPLARPPTTTTPTTTTPGALSTITTSPATSSTTTTTPIPGAAPTAPGLTTPATAQPLTKEDPTTKLRKTKNRIQQTEVDGEM